MITCLIIDDEPLARRLILSYVERMAGWRCMGTCSTAVEAFAALQDGPVDVLFLDIEMPGVNGLKFAGSLKVCPRIIFITAYAEHAVDAFELAAADYLLKPVTFERFMKAVNKIGLQEPGRAIAPSVVPEDKFIFLKANRRLVKVSYQDIYYIEALGDYLKVHMQGLPLVVNMSLGKLEALLPISHFIRIHRSTIVNISYVRVVEGSIMQVNQTALSISQTYKEQVRKKLT